MPARKKADAQYQPHREDVPQNRGHINVNDSERWLSSMIGGALTAYGLRRRSWPALALSLLGGAFVFRGLTGHCNVYEALGISTNTLGRRKVRTGRAIKVEKTITVDRSPEELYRFWRNVENLPRFMSHLKRVKAIDETHSEWTVKAPAGMTVSWEAKIINEKPNEIIGWCSLEGADVDNAGSVHFTPAPTGSGTEVRVILQYDPPGGMVGAVLATLFGEDPGRQIEEDLRRFKQVMESAKHATEEQHHGKQAS